MVRRASLAIALGILGSCVDQGAGPQPKKIDPAFVQSHLLSAPPPSIEKFDTPLQDKVIYLGNTIDHARVAPGGSLTITHYWRVVKPVGPRWRVFGLVRGPANTSDFMNLGPSDMQLGHGPATWQVGEIIEDPQTIVIRPDWRAPTATVLVGLIEVGKHGTLDRMEATGPHAQDRAIVARTIDIDLSRAPAPKGSVHITRAPGAITVDGVANDPGWAGAVQAELVTAEGSADPVGKATAKLTWDDQYLYAFVSVTDSDITTPYKNQDDPLWKGDCVELFIDADANKRGYVELQVNPRNATFDSWFASTRAVPGDEAWDSNMVTQVKLRGTAEPGDTDTGWDVEIAIPWAAVKGRADNMAVRLPPQVGDRWRLNVVRVDRKTGDDKSVFASSWNRIPMSDFHALDRMLDAVFADATGSIVPQAAGSGSAQGSAAEGSAAGSGSGSGSDSGNLEIRVPGRLEVRAEKAPANDAAAPIVLDQPSLVIDVSANGEANVVGKPFDKAALAQLFRQAAAKSKTTQVIVLSHKGASHGRIVEIMEQAKAAGLSRLAIQTAP
ncbi:MAG TPA: sugar-binding protein [Kofleriaceae bacterium]|nr:sugar-binding protein [Kofleriaceae bacterium]